MDWLFEYSLFGHTLLAWSIFWAYVLIPVSSMAVAALAFIRWITGGTHRIVDIALGLVLVLLVICVVARIELLRLAQ